MITFACTLWEPNDLSFSFSRMYDESWVEKLYRGFQRNTTRPFNFIVFTDKERKFNEVGIAQTQFLAKGKPDYATHCIEPYRLGRAMILVGLDTIITGNIDQLVDYCTVPSHPRKRIAMPRDPYDARITCNGVGLIPPGWTNIWEEHNGQNDMEWIRSFDPAVIDDLYPGQVVSYKGHVKPRGGIGDARIVYFHGEEKPHQLDHLSWVTENWR